LIYLYLFSLVAGGILLGSSILLGGHGDADAHAQLGHGSGPVPEGAGDAAGVESFLASLLSVRFWTFFAAFFGLTGIVFEMFGLSPWSWLTAALSAVMGSIAGGSAVFLVKKLANDQTNSAVKSSDYVGKTGRVMVGFGPGQVGKVRIEVKGSTIDVLAAPVEDGSFGAKDEVIVVEMDGNRAKVARTGASD
jgi:membrane protein implicated in regulation of membrane protease activity